MTLAFALPNWAWGLLFGVVLALLFVIATGR
jgi:ABC-type sulfate transport system permease subunit